MAEHHNIKQILTLARDLVCKVQMLIENKWLCCPLRLPTVAAQLLRIYEDKGKHAPHHTLPFTVLAAINLPGLNHLPVGVVTWCVTFFIYCTFRGKKKNKIPQVSSSILVHLWDFYFLAKMQSWIQPEIIFMKQNQEMIVYYGYLILNVNFLSKTFYCVCFNIGHRAKVNSYPS